MAPEKKELKRVFNICSMVVIYKFARLLNPVWWLDFSLEPLECRRKPLESH